MTTETPVTQAPEPVAAAETAAPKATPALNPLSRWDLTTNFMKFLDPHLSLPLLVFVSDKKLYPASELLRGRYDLLCKTKLIDLAGDLLQELRSTGVFDDGEIARQKELLGQRRTAVLRGLQMLEDQMAPVKALLNDPKLLEAVKQDRLFTPQELEQEFHITQGHLDVVYKYGRAQYEIGRYAEALQYVALFGSLSGENTEKRLGRLWGRLAGEILMRQWDMALTDVQKIRDAIEAVQGASSLQLLHMRCWLMHQAMFVFFNQQPGERAQEGRNAIVDMLFQDRYMNAVQTSCPYLLRYLAAAVVTNKRRRTMLPELARVLRQEEYSYRDPVTEFVGDLVTRADFDSARERLAVCADVLANDFFLAPLAQEFVESGRLLVFESFVRVNQRIEIATLAQKLGMKPDVAERWVVDLIRNSRLDAKIDSAHDLVIVGSPFQNVYQQVIEKTKQLSLRSLVLSNNILALEQTGVVAGSQTARPFYHRTAGQPYRPKQPSTQAKPVEVTDD